MSFLKILFICLLCFICQSVLSQDLPIGGGSRGNRGNPIGGASDRLRNLGSQSGGKADSLKKRNYNEDSITISYRFIKDPQRFSLDTVINDYKRFATQPQFITLGNTGAPTKSILYSPIMNAGFDEGRHSLDVYRRTIDNLKFYNTTRPFTELDYVLGSKAEQNIQLIHTQNIQPNWNAAFDYRLISAPGYFINQKNNHNNLSFNSFYQSKKKRYANWFAYINNNFKNNDYGGLKNLSDLEDPTFIDRALIPTNLNGNPFTSRSPFDNKLESGQQEKEKKLFLKQSYDFGKKDSVAINDSTTQYLFYPKLRLEHTISTENNTYLYKGLLTDTTFYKTLYGFDTLFYKSGANFQLTDAWKNFFTDFSMYQFPDAKNTLQFIKAGISFEQRTGNFSEGAFRINKRNINNLWLHGEYRNKTKNKKWDIQANGLLYLSGYNSGDYEVNATLIRNLGIKLGNLQLSFQNINRTPSFIFYEESAFNFGNNVSLNKENHTQLSASFYNEKKKQEITAQLLLASNVTNWVGYKLFRQEDAFNLLKISFARSFKLYRKIMLHTDVHFQQVLVGSPQINFPRVYTRNRIAYEGNFGRKNLRIATGLEFRYLLPYKLDAWSPMLSQFIYQDSISSKNNLPDIHAYMHFNITRFTAFIRAENLNSSRIVTGNINPGLRFTNNNFAAMLYPNPGLVMRVGIYWRFIN